MAWIDLKIVCVSSVCRGFMDSGLSYHSIEISWCDDVLMQFHNVQEKETNRACLMNEFE